jgi:murein DD-endopeptidase MepM/ murein hydrolase activator NlpD
MALKSPLLPVLHQLILLWLGYLDRRGGQMLRYGNSSKHILVAILAGLATVLMLLSSAAASAGAARFRPPFDGTRRLTVFFDHQTPRCYWAGQPVCDGYVWIYTGERVVDSTPHPYDGHEGIDWSMSDGTPIYATASGAIVAFGTVGGYGDRIVVDHQNGYFTLYAHLQDYNNLWLGKSVVAGDLIGYSGHSGGGDCGAHLHFGVYRDDWTAGNETDPFGWRGSVPDPLIAYNGESATCLWRSSDEDPVSCADTIIEDAAQGSTVVGSWNESIKGNGYHAYYRTNTTDSSMQATWISTRIVSGIYKVYAFDPEQPPGVTTPQTQQAQYSVWTNTGWQTRTINQSIYTNTWVPLGTFRIPAAQAQVVLSANTGEAAGTRLVMADAIKFRSYLDHLPLVLKCWPAILPATPTLNTINNPTRNPNYIVSWQPVSGAESYTLQEATNPGFTGAVTVYSGAEISWAVTNKLVGTYYYRVRATNCAGDSGWSNVQATTVSSAGWQTITSQNFEGTFPGSWIVWDDNGTSNGEYYWGKRTCHPYAGSYSGWGVGGGAQGSALGCGSNYPHNADGLMVYGPFSLQDAIAADLRFNLWLFTEPQNDMVFYATSINGTNFYGYALTGNSQGWMDISLDLANVPPLGSTLGQSQVWVALGFASNGSTSYAEGGYVDDIVLRRCYRECTSESGVSTSEGGQVYEAPMTMTLQRDGALEVPGVGPQPFASPLAAPYK